MTTAVTREGTEGIDVAVSAAKDADELVGATDGCGTVAAVFGKADDVLEVPDVTSAGDAAADVTRLEGADEGARPGDSVSTAISADRKSSSSVALGGLKNAGVGVTNGLARADRKAASSIGSAIGNAGTSDVDWTINELSAAVDIGASVSVGSGAMVEMLEGAGVLDTGRTFSADPAPPGSTASACTSSSRPPMSLPRTTP